MAVTVTQSYSNFGGGALGSGTYDRHVMMAVSIGNIFSYGGDPQNLIIGGGGFNMAGGWTANSSHIDFQLLGKKRIATGIRVTKSGGHGDWIARGSQDGLSWTDLGTITFTATATEVINCSSNTTAYAYYQLMPTSGDGGSGMAMSLVEFEFSGNQYEWGNRNTGSLVTATLSFTPSGGGGLAMFDGVLANNGTNAWWSGDPATGASIQFDFADPVEIMSIYSFDSGTGGDNATWKIQKWNGSAWIDMSSPKLWDLSSVAGKTFPVTTDGVASTRWRMLGTAGNMNSGPFYWEFGFDIVDASIAPSVNADLVALGIEVLNAGDGSNASMAATALEILNTGDGSTASVPLVAIEVLSTRALAPMRAVDGGKIYEFSFAFQPETQYSESDWDSIYSVGDRVGNGTMIMDSDFPGSNIGTVPSNLMDYRADTHFTVEGGNPAPLGSSLTFATADGSAQFISGIRFTGSNHILDGFWAHFGGYDGRIWLKNTIEFDEFLISITTPYPQFDGYKYELSFTPTFFPWNFWTISYTNMRDSDDGFMHTTTFGSELMLKVYHSVLDGGNRLPTNGRSIKRVEITTSAGITPFLSNTSTLTPLQNLIDGVYASNDKLATQLRRTGGSSGDYQITAPGEYVQFKFPRKVVMRETVWNTGVDYGGGETLDPTTHKPTVYGTWQWQGSNAASSGYVNVGEPWHFGPGSIWIKSPKVIAERVGDEFTDMTPYLYPYWRMVLVEGPAFGSDANCNLFQIQFNLIDPDNQAPLWELQFTDDTSDAFTGTANPIVVGSPFEANFSDSSEDRLDATAAITNNYILTAAFTDAADDALSAFGSFYPSTYPQVVINTKGK